MRAILSALTPAARATVLAALVVWLRALAAAVRLVVDAAPSEAEAAQETADALGDAATAAMLAALPMGADRHAESLCATWFCAGAYDAARGAARGVVGAGDVARALGDLEDARAEQTAAARPHPVVRVSLDAGQGSGLRGLVRGVAGLLHAWAPDTYDQHAAHLAPDLARLTSGRGGAGDLAHVLATLGALTQRKVLDALETPGDTGDCPAHMALALDAATLAGRAAGALRALLPIPEGFDGGAAPGLEAALDTRVDPFADAQPAGRVEAVERGDLSARTIAVAKIAGDLLTEQGVRGDRAELAYMTCCVTAAIGEHPERHALDLAAELATVAAAEAKRLSREDDARMSSRGGDAYTADALRREARAAAEALRASADALDVFAETVDVKDDAA